MLLCSPLWYSERTMFRATARDTGDVDRVAHRRAASLVFVMGRVDGPCQVHPLSRTARPLGSALLGGTPS